MNLARITAASPSSPASVVLTCDDVEALLPLVADGVIDDASDPALFAHLAHCVDCQEALTAHDLIHVAIEQTSAPIPATGNRRKSLSFQQGHYRRIPWPVAMAASLAAAIGLWTWLQRMQAARAQDNQVHTQVIPVVTDDGHSVYVVIDGDNITIVDPRSIDGQAAPVREATLPVKLRR